VDTFGPKKGKGQNPNIAREKGLPGEAVSSSGEDSEGKRAKCHNLEKKKKKTKDRLKQCTGDHRPSVLTLDLILGR